MKTLFRSCIIFLWVCLIACCFKVSNRFEKVKNHSRTLNIFTWPGYISDTLVKEFEKETGIKVFRHFYSSNEELLIKLKTSDSQNYDIVIPSDYAVAKLIDEKLIRKLDYKHLHFFKDIDNQLLNHPFDPLNQYSVPYTWEVIGLGIDTQAYDFSPINISWSEVFHPSTVKNRVAMVNDPIEAIDIAARFLFDDKNILNKNDKEEIANLLKAQKKYVEAYTELRGDYLLSSKSTSIAVIPSPYGLQCTNKNSHITFNLPKEFTFISIENVCIPICSRNNDLAYEFIQYLFRPEIMARESELFYDFPSLMTARCLLKHNRVINKTLEDLKNYNGDLLFFRTNFEEKEISNLWVGVKGY